MAFVAGCIIDAFSSGYIYEKENRTEIRSIQHGLQEFCRYLEQTQPFKFPVKCKVKYPLYSTNVSYASVAKKESTVTAHDNILGHPLSDKSYSLHGQSTSVAHVARSSQVSKLPETHNKQMAAKVNSSNNCSSQHTRQGSKLPEPYKMMNAKVNGSSRSTSSQHKSQGSKLPETHNRVRTAQVYSSSSTTSQHGVESVEMEHYKNISDRRQAQCPRTQKASSRELANKNEELSGYSVSDTKSCHHKGSEAYNTSAIPRDDAQIHSSRYATRSQSRKNLTKEPESTTININAPKNSNDSDNLKLKNSTGQNSAQANGTDQTLAM